MIRSSLCSLAVLASVLAKPAFARETVFETLASQPAEVPYVASLAQASSPAQRVGSSFGRTTRLADRALSSMGLVRDFFSSTLSGAMSGGGLRLAAGAVEMPEAACGPSPFANTLSCVSLASGSEIGQYPVPGEVSTTPIFVDDSWVIGTAEGVLIRSLGILPNGAPAFRSMSASFWGPRSRRVIGQLREAQKGNGKEAESAAFRESMGWRWTTTNSSEYVGKPIVHKDLLYVLTANQFLHAIDWQTGATRWASRLSADTPLRMASVSLAASDREIIVGGDDGFLTAFDPARGTQLWRVPLASLRGAADQPSAQTDRFPAIVTPVVTGARAVIVANAESRLHRVSLETRQAEWSFPFGSVAAMRLEQDMLYVGTSSGEIVAVRERTGELRWKTKFSPEAPVASLQVINDQYLLVASTSGRVGLLDKRTGSLLDNFHSGMDFVGEWFQRGQTSAEACITVSRGGLRCFGARK